LGISGGAEGGETVGAEERAGHDQRAGAAAADHVERLMAGEPGADRDQRRAGAAGGACVSTLSPSG
jgi:hypothetical protein